MMRRKQVPDLIVITNAQGVVVSFGGPGYPSPGVERGQAGVTSNYTGWDGFVRADTTAMLRAYGVFLGEDRACEFAVNPLPSLSSPRFVV